MNRFFKPIVQTFLAAPICYIGVAQALRFAQCEEEDDEPIVLWNWSGTTKATPTNIYEPETRDELMGLVRSHHEDAKKLRVLGSALSPNGIGFSDKDILAMVNQDEIINIDPDAMTVRVQAGCQIHHLCDALLKQGLTLQNLASISSQQVGGFTQVGAHGTGWNIPPVDMQVIGLQAYVPSLGLIELDERSDLFYWMRLGLGTLGVITELTLQCVRAHNLAEKVYTLPFSEAKKKYKEVVSSHKHVKCLYIPYTDTVVLFELNEVTPSDPKKSTRTEDCSVMRDLVREVRGNVPDFEEMGFANLRDELLKADFDNVEHIKKVNAAEAAFWKSIDGIAIGRSDQLLHFDCGGQQLVLETCFPVSGDNDFAYIEELYSIIYENGMPAPGPIEQRWTSRSTSKMSPAYSDDPDQKFCWVGVIMYLPTQDPADRDRITDLFKKYTELLRPLMRKYKAQTHWGKIPYAENEESLKWTKAQLKQTYPVEQFTQLRRLADPNNILSNDMLDAFFPV